MKQEKIWLEGLENDDSSSFTQIYDQYWRGLFVHAHKVLGDKDVAEDIVQDTFTNLWTNRDKATTIQSLAAYLKASVRHACIQYIERHINRYNFVELLPDILDNILTESSTLNKIYLEEVEQCIAYSVAEMPPKMRQVFELSRYENKTRKEIAEQLEISPETVKKHIQHALEILKKSLNKLDSYQKAALIFSLLWVN